MSLGDQCRQWLQSRGYWHPSGRVGTGGERSEHEEQDGGSSPVVDNDSPPGQLCADDSAKLGWIARAFAACALTWDNVRQGIPNRMSANPWSAGVTAVLLLLLLLLVYHEGAPFSSPDAEIPEAMEPIPESTLEGTASVNNATFSCSKLRLRRADTAVDSLRYHIFPSDRNLQDACRSKLEQHCLRKNTHGKFSPPSKFLALLRRYEEYHENCTKGYDLTALGIAGDTPAGCKYLVWKALDGMGNQLLSLVCAFVYSLLTNRVMLIDTGSHIDTHLCNPFPFSSWVLPADFPESKLRTQATRVFVYLDNTLATLRRNSSCTTIPPDDLQSFIDAAPKHLHAYIICCDHRRDHQFFCPTAQKLFSGANWFFYLSHEYTLPGLYFVPEFRDKLNDWFPRHDAFMHASRYLLNPENSLWGRILQYYRDHMDFADKLVGIQPRSWRGEYQPSISKQILRCAVEQKLLPPLRKGKKARDETGSASGKPRHVHVSVLVTSLRAEYRDNLAFEYTNHPNAGNLVVDVISASKELRQRTGDMEHDAKAIIDIWLLSFVHNLVITPFSTFGSTASGFAGIVPLLFRNYGANNLRQPACTMTNVYGPCFIVYPKDQPCDLDPARASIFDPNQKVPEVKLCDFNPGLGILTA